MATSNEPEKLKRSVAYPLADNPPYQLTERLYRKYGPKRDESSRYSPGGMGARHGWMKSNIKAVWTGEKRPPRKGEWYLSGSTIEAYRAPNDLSTPYHIAQLVRVELVTVETKIDLTEEDLNG